MDLFCIPVIETAGHSRYDPGSAVMGRSDTYDPARLYLRHHHRRLQTDYRHDIELSALEINLVNAMSREEWNRL